MKLTSHNIQFIDQYLQKSDVIFVDVRAELTDHIASAVEEKMSLESSDFYDAFKAYMIVNKKELLSLKNTTTGAYREGIFQFLKSLTKWYNLVLLVLVGIGIPFLNYNSATILSLKDLNKLLFLSILVFALFGTVYSYLILKKRYLYLEKTSFVLGLIYYINLIFNGFYNNFYGNSATLVITIFLFLAYVSHYFSTILKFKNQYR